MNQAFEKQIQRILIAIDESENSRRAVSYVGDLLQGTKDFKILLLHIINEPEEDFFASVTEKEDWMAEKQHIAEDVIENCKDLLVRKGFDPRRIFTEIKVRNCPSIGECILNESESSQAQTIVVGRKGVSRKEEFLFGSVSNRIVHQAKGSTVWVVG